MTKHNQPPKRYLFKDPNRRKYMEENKQPKDDHFDLFFSELCSWRRGLFGKQINYDKVRIIISEYKRFIKANPPQ